MFGIYSRVKSSKFNSSSTGWRSLIFFCSSKSGSPLSGSDGSQNITYQSLVYLLSLDNHSEKEGSSSPFSPFSISEQPGIYNMWYRCFNVSFNAVSKAFQHFHDVFRTPITTLISSLSTKSLPQIL